METVTSRSGTRMGYERTGSGPPLVLVHGSLNDSTAWAGVAPALADRYTVYAVNRRGRPGSDPMGPHALEDEFEDIAAVVDAAGEAAHLFGHSAGALCALGATLLTKNVRSLMLYEPPEPGTAGDREMLGELRALMEAGEADEVVATFLVKGPGVPEEQIGAMRASPIWPEFVAYAQCLVEEIDAVAHHDFDAGRFAHLTMPVLLLSGEQSPPDLRVVMEAVAKVAPHAQVRSLPGEGHAAHRSSPELVATELLRFLDEA